MRVTGKCEICLILDEIGLAQVFIDFILKILAKDSARLFRSICSDLALLDSQKLVDSFDGDAANGEEPTTLPYFHFRNYANNSARNIFPPPRIEYRNLLKVDKTRILQEINRTDQVSVFCFLLKSVYLSKNTNHWTILDFLTPVRRKIAVLVKF